jgi:succinate CoA transferase
MKSSLPQLTADEAARYIKHGQTVAFSGFTPAGSPKAVPTALAQLARSEHEAGRPFKIGVVTGASTGPSLDGELAKADAVAWRTPYQSNPDLRKAINEGRTQFFDMHLSLLPQYVRYGFLGKIDCAVIEACDVTAEGQIVLTTAVGAAPTFCAAAEKIIIELNSAHPSALFGFHDIYEPQSPPYRREIPLYRASDRIGSPVIQVDPSKIVGIVHTHALDEVGGFDPTDSLTHKIGENVADFLAAELKAGRIPSSFLPIQSGVGNIANAVLGAMGEHPELPAFDMYSEVIQDSVLALMRRQKIRFASGVSLTVSPGVLKELYADLSDYRSRLLLRPQEISNNPEVVRRIGIISINTALELDIFGNVNSTHVLGKNMMNGIGGSGDFTRNAYISIFTCPSVAKGGAISTIVPLCSHMDHSEHSVQVVITEQGIADLRGKNPAQRAELIIERCAHPDYKQPLRDYMKLSAAGQTPQTLGMAFAFHQQFLRTGSMKGVEWTAKA